MKVDQIHPVASARMYQSRLARMVDMGPRCADGPLFTPFLAVLTI